MQKKMVIFDLDETLASARYSCIPFMGNMQEFRMRAAVSNQAGNRTFRSVNNDLDMQNNHLVNKDNIVKKHNPVISSRYYLTENLGKYNHYFLTMKYDSFAINFCIVYPQKIYEIFRALAENPMHRWAIVTNGAYPKLAVENMFTKFLENHLKYSPNSVPIPNISALFDNSKFSYANCEHGGRVREDTNKSARICWVTWQQFGSKGQVPDEVIFVDDLYDENLRTFEQHVNEFCHPEFYGKLKIIQATHFYSEVGDFDIRHIMYGSIEGDKAIKFFNTAEENLNSISAALGIDLSTEWSSCRASPVRTPASLRYSSPELPPSEFIQHVRRSLGQRF